MQTSFAIWFWTPKPFTKLIQTPKMKTSLGFEFERRNSAFFIFYRKKIRFSSQLLNCLLFVLWAREKYDENQIKQLQICLVNKHGHVTVPLKSLVCRFLYKITCVKIAHSNERNCNSIEWFSGTRANPFFIKVICDTKYFYYQLCCCFCFQSKSEHCSFQYMETFSWPETKKIHHTCMQ